MNELLKQALTRALQYHLLVHCSHAKRAVACLDRHHAMKKRGAVPCSLYLDALMRRGTNQEHVTHRQVLQQDKLQQCLDRVIYRIPIMSASALYVTQVSL